ncbi:hypothetical protein CsSME_00010579 [Camellia sinensis var. sinensis]
MMRFIQLGWKSIGFVGEKEGLQVVEVEKRSSEVSLFVGFWTTSL